MIIILPLAFARRISATRRTKDEMALLFFSVDGAAFPGIQCRPAGAETN
jgi:hypothetical protein